jgi:hypothetical protein
MPMIGMTHALARAPMAPHRAAPGPQVMRRLQAVVHHAAEQRSVATQVDCRSNGGILLIEGVWW